MQNRSRGSVGSELQAKMNPSTQLVVFALDAQLFALELVAVHRVVRAIEITPLPHAPAVIAGVINVQGELFSVVNLRHRFRLPEREVIPNDQFILVDIAKAKTASKIASQSTSNPTSTPSRKFALVVDAVTGIRAIGKESIVAGEEIVPNLAYIQGVAKLADELILIHDLERCLSLQEENMLDDALAQMGDP